MLEITKIERSPRLNKRFRVFLSDTHYYDFGYENSEGKHANTYIDNATDEERHNYMVRHLGNTTESNLIRKRIPSPSLFSFFLLWNTRDLRDNIEILNKEWKRLKY
jgi:hypothetical protein